MSAKRGGHMPKHSSEGADRSKWKSSLVLYQNRQRTGGFASVLGQTLTSLSTPEPHENTLLNQLSADRALFLPNARVNEITRDVWEKKIKVLILCESPAFLDSFQMTRITPKIETLFQHKTSDDFVYTTVKSGQTFNVVWAPFCSSSWWQMLQQAAKDKLIHPIVQSIMEMSKLLVPGGYLMLSKPRTNTGDKLPRASEFDDAAVEAVIKKLNEKHEFMSTSNESYIDAFNPDLKHHYLLLKKNQSIEPTMRDFLIQTRLSETQQNSTALDEKIQDSRDDVQFRQDFRTPAEENELRILDMVDEITIQRNQILDLKETITDLKETIIEIRSKSKKRSVDKRKCHLACEEKL